MSETQTVWSGVFAALHPQHIYQYNLQTLDQWVCDLLDIVPIHHVTPYDNRDLQLWYDTLRIQLQQDPHDFYQQYTELNQQLLSTQTDLTQILAPYGMLLDLKQHISQKIEQLQQLKDVVPDLALQLQHVSRQVWLDRRHHEQQSLDLDEAMLHLEQDIQSFKTSIMALVGMSSLAIIFGGLASGLLWPLGGLVWLILLPTVVVMFLLLRSDYHKLRDDQDLLQIKQQQVQDLRQQMELQYTQMECYHSWLAQTTTMQQRVGQILAAWQTLDSDVGMTITQLDSARLAHERGHQRAAQQHWEDAQVEWRAAYEHIQALCIRPLPNHTPQDVISLDLGLTTIHQQITKVYQQP